MFIHFTYQTVQNRIHVWDFTSGFSSIVEDSRILKEEKKTLGRKGGQYLGGRIRC